MTSDTVPKITLIFGIESNTAFFIAIFVFMCALAWAIRDHRARQLVMNTKEQEDHLYLAILTILFILCTIGAWYAFRRSTAQRLLNVRGEPMEREIELQIAERLRLQLPNQLKDRDDKDLFYMMMAAIFITTLGIGGYFIAMKQAFNMHVQYPQQDPQQETN